MIGAALDRKSPSARERRAARRTARVAGSEQSRGWDPRACGPLVHGPSERAVERSVAGERPTFVFLHGFTGSPASWDAVVAKLPAHARVLRPALLGHELRAATRPRRRGPCLKDSSRAAADGFLAEVERLRAWLDRECVPRAHLVGYSLGGRVGYHLLAVDPARFTGATLIGAHPGLANDLERAARRRADAAWIDRLERDGIDAFVRAWAELPLWSTQRELPFEVLAAQDAIRRSHDPIGLGRALRTLGLAEMPPVLPDRLTLPVHLVVGGRDVKHRELAAAFVEQLPEGRLTVVAGAGHNVVLERPDVIASLLWKSCAPLHEEKKP